MVFNEKNNDNSVTVGFSPLLYCGPYVTPLGNPFNTM